jgi:hypothetical protein
MLLTYKCRITSPSLYETFAQIRACTSPIAIDSEKRHVVKQNIMREQWTFVYDEYFVDNFCAKNYKWTI